MDVPTFKFALREDLVAEKRFLPTRGEPLSTGWDVRAAQEDRMPIVLRPGKYFKIPLGFRAYCPSGWWYELNPRSSSFVKKSIHSLIGIIDETYSLPLVWAGQYLPDVSSLGNDLVINFGDAIGQIIPIRRQEMSVKEINNQEYDALCKKRNAVRTGGFGSTDSEQQECK